MNQWLTQQFIEHSRLLVECLVSCCFLAATWAGQRTRRWLIEHLARERREHDRVIAALLQQELSRSNETLRILTEASVSAERPTLQSLLADEKRDWSLTSSDERQPAPDWSDDHLRTQQVSPSSWPPAPGK